MVSKGTFPGCWIRCIRRVYCPPPPSATHRTPSMEHIHDMQAENTCQMSLCAHRSTRARAHKLKRTASSAISPPSLTRQAKISCNIPLCMDAEAGLLHGAPPGCCWCCEGGPPVISRCCGSAAKLPGSRIIQQALFSVRAGIPQIGGVEMGGWTREF